ncbi:MAG: hypothetical protein QNL14_11490 [Deltaproteobacteria bacterium]|nr:hypothetical protein [Deltaproteobacteria bacterium]
MSEDHHNHHHHNHDSPGELSFDEKFEKMLAHWIKHNEDHASNYRNWAEKAKANGKEKAGKFLLEAARMSLETNDLFKKALAELDDN